MINLLELRQIEEKKEKKQRQDKQLLLKKEELKKNRLLREPSCKLIVIDNFYKDPIAVREFALSQDFFFSSKGFPGKRTKSFSSIELKEKIENYVRPFSGKITTFKIPENDSEPHISNGCFQYTMAKDSSWVHTDSFNNWAGVLYLTPDAPLSAGTGFFQYIEGSRGKEDSKILDISNIADDNRYDMTKWALTDRVANVFNRLILFDSNQYHMSLDYFGTNKDNGRLFQVFFFITEK